MSKEKNIETVRNFYDLFEQKKFLEVSELFVTDGEEIRPYHSELFPLKTVGKKNIYESWINLEKNFGEIKFLIDEIMPIEDSNKVLVKLSGKIKFKNKAGYYENSYIYLFYFDENGKILQLYEYFNPVIAAKALGLLDKICK
ncbi:MAG: nuclear transport factor 2 family protein [Candidatus Heimdallarchaeota archaeon]|nr:nuclear transport factor 2 family protein [Candidatus Heimdallarchaeota archaeon]